MKSSPVAALIFGISLIVSTVILSKAIKQFGDSLFGTFHQNPSHSRHLEVTVRGGTQALGVEMK